MRLPKYTWTVLSGLTVVGLFVVAFMPQPVSVEVAPVIRGTFQQTIDEDGKTRVRQRYTVSAPVAGTLRRMQLKAGDAVTKNMLLATIAPSVPPLLDVRTESELRERLGAAEATHQRALAEVARVQAVRDQAQADMQRTRQLAERGLVSRSQFEQAELAWKTASRELEAARQAEHAAQHDVAVARAALVQWQNEAAGVVVVAPQLWSVTSPIQGRVLRVLQESEGVVAAGTPLLELANAADLEVVVDVLTTDAVHIHPGTPVRFEQWGLEQALAGQVRLIEPGAFTKVSALGVEEQRVNVIIDFVSPVAEWQSLGDNYRIEARILIYRHDNAVQLPTSALFRERQQWLVFVVQDGRAQRREVQLGRRNAVEAMVETGVSEGEQVITYPSDAVQHGVRVTQR